MTLRYFVSCWGNEVDMRGALRLANEWRADGIEGPVPRDEANREALEGCTLPWVAEVATGGGYVPKPHLSPAQHFDDLRRQVEECLPFAPLLINVLAGSDAWTFSEKVGFFAAAQALEGELQVPLAFETHRSRPTFEPWAVRDLLAELSHLWLTCDFSHWCAVTERLVLDEELDILRLVARHARHIHARVGYDQGPQVPDPRAPEYDLCLEAHLRWWRTIITTQAAEGLASLTITPEFGPDGYLQCEPFTRRPAADLRQVNHWMMEHLRQMM